MIEFQTITTIKEENKKPKESKFKKVSLVFWAFIYFGLTIALCLSGTWAFTKFYYYPIYVSGPSMEPTLNGGSGGYNSRLDFGFIDTHESVIKSIERFDIITTFYPFSPDDYQLPYVKGSSPLKYATHKIKRVMGIPGDTFTIKDDVYYLLNKTTNEVEEIELPFEVKNASNSGSSSRYSKVNFKSKGYGDENGFVTLGEDEYWVMGDNWLVSKDSYSDSKGGPVYEENIVGVLIAIVGTCLVKDEQIYDRQYTTPRFFK